MGSRYKAAVGLLADFSADQRRRGLSPGTIESRHIQLRAWMLYLDTAHSIHLFASTAEQLERFLDGRKITPRTRYVWLSNLHAFYSWARRMRYATNDPTAELIRPKIRQGLPRPIPDADLFMALRLAPPKIRAWIALGAFAGLRCLEISGLQRADILETDKLIRVLGKGNKERLVPLHPYVRDSLHAAGLPRAGRLWDDSPALVSRRGGEYLRSIGVDCTMHQLRHWFGSRTYQECQDLRAVQSLLGHSSPTTTAVYAAFSPTVARRAVEGLVMEDAPVEDSPARVAVGGMPAFVAFYEAAFRLCPEFADALVLVNPFHTLIVMPDVMSSRHGEGLLISSPPPGDSSHLTLQP